MRIATHRADAGGAVHVRLADPFSTIATVASFDPEVSPLTVRYVIFQKYVAAANVPPDPTAATASPVGGAHPPGSTLICVLVTALDLLYRQTGRAGDLRRPRGVGCVA